MHINSTVETEKYFISLSDSEFDGDRGFTLKFLVDLHKGYFPSVNEEYDNLINMIIGKVAEVEKRLEGLEIKPKEKVKGIKMFSGRQLEVGKK